MKRLHQTLFVASRRKATRLGALAAVALVLAACSKSPPEAQLAQAGEALGEATTELADIDTRIERAEALLQKLRGARREQRNRVRTLEQILEARATDVALFRAIQTTLLNDERLQNAAIVVNVEDGVVTLTGLVRTEEEAGHAVAVSRRTAGVEKVLSQIRVDDPETAGTSGN